MYAEPPRRAAVLLMLFEKDGETHLVLTRRTDTVATHKGQISLPGGVRELFDESLLRTALRETEEELGITPDQVEIVGEMEDVHTATSNFLVKPYIARLAAIPTYRPDSLEVAEVIEVPVSALRRPDIFREETRTLPEDPNHKVYFYQYGEYVIWGATARILMQFLQRS